MKKQKVRHYTSMKYKAIDLLTYLAISFASMGVLYLLMPKKPDLIQIIILLLILIPTVVALIGGAPFVPTPMRGVEKLLKTAGVKKGETVIDIGCGDGRFCYIAANKIGAKAIGVELSPLVYLWAKVRQFIWRSKAKIKFGDFRMLDLSDADHILAYMLPETLIKFIPKFEKELKPGTKVTSYAFKIGDWAPVHLEPADKEENLSRILVYEIGKQYKD